MASGPDLLPAIALSSNATVVRVNYRLSDQRPYPKPIHDVLAGYHWIKSHLGQGITSSGYISEPNQVRRLGVCGEFIGGSLAGMLALTECHTDRQGISAAVLGNPIADWTSLFSVDEDMDAIDPIIPSSHNKSERPAALGAGLQDAPTLDSLLRIRKKIFPQPAKFFDPFASPSLFFCTPAMELPPPINLLLDDQASPSDPSSPEDDSLPRKRRHRRTYPPANTALRIPRIRIEVGKENVLHDQGVEFARLIRKSRSSQGKEASEKGEAYEEEEQNEVLEREGTGLWGEKEADDIGRWLAQRLSRGYTEDMTPHSSE